MNLKRIFALVALVAGWAGSAPAWDDTGHLIIGEIAARRLRPEVVRELTPLAALLDPRFNDGKPYNLVTANVWLDDQRGLGAQNPWKKLHYIDFPVIPGGNPPEPPPPHALSALDAAVALLKNRQAPPAERAVALAEVMHIVGDLHQPMHAADRGDRGGNEIRLCPLLPNGGGPANLHAFWDGAYRLDVENGAVTELWPRFPRSAWPGAPGEPGLIARQATALTRDGFLPPSSAAPATRPWVGWARETYAVACRSGWPEGAVKGTPATLSPAFVHEAHRVSEGQLAKAGARLGDLLNALLGDGRR